MGRAATTGTAAGTAERGTRQVDGATSRRAGANDDCPDFSRSKCAKACGEHARTSARRA